MYGKQQQDYLPEKDVDISKKTSLTHDFVLVDFHTNQVLGIRPRGIVTFKLDIISQLRLTLLYGKKLEDLHLHRHLVYLMCVP